MVTFDEYVKILQQKAIEKKKKPNHGKKKEGNKRKKVWKGGKHSNYGWTQNTKEPWEVIQSIFCNMACILQLLHTSLIISSCMENNGTTTFKQH